MNNKKYGDTNIENVEVGPLATRYMKLYGVNINLQRAIPFVQDGLKPVQRRILFQLWKNYRNSPKTRVSVLMGDVMKIHPHGDQGLGDVIARMCQPFTNNIPLISSLGNSGNITSGRDAAAARYLDVKMTSFASDVLFDEFDGKVGMTKTYDDSSYEPFALPSKFPIILLNGSSGIGYTLSSDIPPYNINDVADATIKLLKNPEAKINIVPDSPTGCDIIIKDSNSFIMQSSYDVDNVNYIITIKNTPYMRFLEDIDNELRNIQSGPNPIKEILSADDESVLIDNVFKYTIRCAPSNLYKVVDTLFKRVPGFRIGISTRNMVVVDPSFNTKNLSTRQILCSWIRYRLEYKRGWFLRKLVARDSERNMLIGKAFMLSAENLDKTIKIFRSCKNKDAIVPSLLNGYPGKVSSSQAKYISELRMYQLTKDEYDKTVKLINEIEDEIEYIRDVVDDPEKIKNIIIDEIKTIKQKYGCPRKSKILNKRNDKQINVDVVQRLIDGSIVFGETENPEHLSSDVTPISTERVCLIDDKGYFIWIDTNKVPRDKQLTLTSIGKSVMGKCVAVISDTLNGIILLSNKGRIKYMGINNIPSNATRKPLIPLSSDEEIVSVLEVTDDNSDILIYTKDGLGKRIQTKSLNKVSSVDSVGQFIVKDNDVSGMFYINSNKPFLVYVTRLGRIRVNHSKFLTTGKKFDGLKPIIKLSQQDDLVAVFCVDKDQKITLNHADGRVSTVNIDSIPVSTMSIPPERPKHVPGVKVIRSIIS